MVGENMTMQRKRFLVVAASVLAAPVFGWLRRGDGVCVRPIEGVRYSPSMRRWMDRSAFRTVGEAAAQLSRRGRPAIVEQG
jgi:hypothetical protein